MHVPIAREPSVQFAGPHTDDCAVPSVPLTGSTLKIFADQFEATYFVPSAPMAIALIWSICAPLAGDPLEVGPFPPPAVVVTTTPPAFADFLSPSPRNIAPVIG